MGFSRREGPELLDVDAVIELFERDNEYTDLVGLATITKSNVLTLIKEIKVLRSEIEEYHQTSLEQDLQT